jgi:hypothetical protein
MARHAPALLPRGVNSTRDRADGQKESMLRISQDLQRSAMARSTERGFNGWYTYGFWYAAMTGAVSVAGLIVCKIWGPKLGEIDPPIKKGHKDMRTGEVHYFQSRAQPSTTDEPTKSSESDARG